MRLTSGQVYGGIFLTNGCCGGILPIAGIAAPGQVILKGIKKTKQAMESDLVSSTLLWLLLRFL